MILEFILACYGLTNILIYSKILEGVRPNGYFFKCSMCIGFYAGIITSTFLFGIVSPIMVLKYGLISSGTSYMLDKLVDDEGFKISK